MQKEEGQQIEGNEEYDYAVDPKTGCRFYRQSRANLQTASPSSSTWDQTQWKTRIWFSQHSLTTGEFFLRVRTGFGCLEKNLQPTDRRCEQCTHKYSTYRVAQHITFHHANTRGSRLRIAHLCVPQTLVIHVSCLIPCRTWHWPPAQVHSHPFHHFSFLSTSPPFRRLRLHPKSAFRWHSRLQNRGKNLNVVFVLLRCCRGNADVQSSSLHSVRAGPGWRASPLLSHFSKNGSLGAIWPCALDVRQLFVCKVLGTPFQNTFLLSQQIYFGFLASVMISNSTASVGLWRSGQHLPVCTIRTGARSRVTWRSTNESTRCRDNDDSAQNSCIWIAEPSKSDAKAHNGSASLVLSSEHANAGADSRDTVCSYHFVLVVRFRSAVTCDACCCLVVTRRHHRWHFDGWRLDAAFAAGARWREDHSDGVTEHDGRFHRAVFGGRGFARLASHDGQRAITQTEESARVVPDHVAGGRLGAVQLSRHKTQTGHCEGHARTTKTHTLHHCAGTGRVIVQAACSPDLNPLDTWAWNVVKREMVAVRGRVTLKAEAVRAWTAARSCQQPGRLLHEWDERLPLCTVANGGTFGHIYFIRLARLVNAIDTNALSQCTQTSMTDHKPTTTARTRWPRNTPQHVSFLLKNITFPIPWQDVLNAFYPPKKGPQWAHFVLFPGFGIRLLFEPTPFKM